MKALKWTDNDIIYHDTHMCLWGNISKIVASRVINLVLSIDNEHVYSFIWDKLNLSIHRMYDNIIENILDDMPKATNDIN
jgi:hypothetical protein